MHDPVLLTQVAQGTQEAVLAELNQVAVGLSLAAAWRAALKPAAILGMAWISAYGAAHTVSVLVWLIHGVHSGCGVGT